MALPNWIKNNTWQFIIGTVIAIAAITVPLVLTKSTNPPVSINQNSQKNVFSVGDVASISDSDIQVGDIIYTGISLEEYEAKICRDRERIRKELQESIQNKEHEKQQKLEIELKAVSEKLNNRQQSFEEETKRRKEAVKALEQLEGTLPEAKIKEAHKNLQSGGDTKIAEKLFDEVDEEGAVLVALAAYQSGQLAEGRIDYAKAIKKYRRAVALENSNPDYLLAAGKMARTLGEYKEAQPWLEKLLQLRQKETTETVELALVQNELANLYRQQGKYEEAEPLYKRSLEIYEKSLGPDHPSVAISLGTLAQLYKQQGKHEEAKPLLTQALDIFETVLGNKHPYVATTLAELAGLYEQQGKYEEAEPLYLRDLEITEKTLGPDHPSVATTLGNLAGLYRQQGKYEEAKPLYKRALDILRRTFPNGHPNIDTIESNYAIMKQTMQSNQ